MQIPLPEGMDFTREVVTNHAVRGRMGQPVPPCPAGKDIVTSSLALTLFPPQGFLTVGADLHFSKGLREVIDKYRPVPTATPYSSPWPAEPSLEPSLEPSSL